MPELPEVETVHRRLAPVIEGARFDRLWHRGDLRLAANEVIGCGAAISAFSTTRRFAAMQQCGRFDVHRTRPPAASIRRK